MRAFSSLILALGTAASLSACASGPSGTDVTRFHLSQPVQRGSVYLEPVDGTRAGTLQFRQVAGAVAAELGEIGFRTVSTREAASLIGMIDYDQNTREAIASRSPVSVGVGGGTFGRNVGVSLGTAFGLGGRPKDVKVTMLELRLARPDGQAVWEGRAITEAKEGTEAASPVAAIPQLADALLRDFPGESGATVTYDR